MIPDQRGGAYWLITIDADSWKKYAMYQRRKVADIIGKYDHFLTLWRGDVQIMMSDVEQRNALWRELVAVVPCFSIEHLKMFGDEQTKKLMEGSKALLPLELLNLNPDEAKMAEFLIERGFVPDFRTADEGPLFVKDYAKSYSDGQKRHAIIDRLRATCSLTLTDKGCVCSPDGFEPSVKIENVRTDSEADRVEVWLRFWRNQMDEVLEYERKLMEERHD